MGGPAFGQPVERPTDTAARGDTTETHKSETTVASAASDTVAGFTNNTGEQVQIDNVSIVVADGTDIDHDLAYVQFVVQDGTGTPQVNLPIALGETITFPGGEPIPDGWSAGILVENHHSASILFAGAMRYR